MFTPEDRFIVVDTETANSIEDPFCYDVGFAVIDIEGNVYESYSYVIADIFLDKGLMTSAYFAEKTPRYWKEIKNGRRELRTYKTVKKKFAEVCRKYDVKIILAHNARFDYRSLTKTQRYLTCSKWRYFIPYGIEIWDTLKMAREVLKNLDEYNTFCHENNYLTKRNVKRYTAEIIYRFISNNNDFEESHTGLEDVMIEKDIFIYCLKNKPDIDGSLWKKGE